jgi:hypothetical protein
MLTGPRRDDKDPPLAAGQQYPLQVGDSGGEGDFVHNNLAYHVKVAKFLLGNGLELAVFVGTAEA